jgi:hypothetical protein
LAIGFEKIEPSTELNEESIKLKMKNFISPRPLKHVFVAAR